MMHVFIQHFQKLIILGFCLTTSIGISQVDPPSLDVEDQDLEVGVLTSQTTTSRLSFNTSNYLLNGSEKRGFIEIDDQILRLGLSNNNSFGNVRLSYNNGTGVQDALTVNNNGYIGIGTTNPLTDLHVQSTFGNPVRIETATFDNWTGYYSSNGYIGYSGVFNGNFDMDFGTGGGNTLGKVNIVCNAQPKLTVEVDGTVTINNQYELPTTDGAAGEVLTTDGSGVVSWQSGGGGTGPEAFRGRLALNLALPNFTYVDVDGFLEFFDTNGNFDDTAGTFTASTAGIYEFTFTSSVVNNPTTYTDAPYTVRWRKNGNAYQQHTDKFTINSGYVHTIQYTVMMELDAGDVMSIEVRQASGAAQALLGGSSFDTTTLSGHKVN